jgi:hypothetical protein
MKKAMFVQNGFKFCVFTHDDVEWVEKSMSCQFLKWC